MTLNSSGPISLGGSTTGQSINLELGQSATTQVSLNDSNVRSLAGVPSGAIVMPIDFWGKGSAANYAVLMYSAGQLVNTAFIVNSDKSVTGYSVDIQNTGGCTYQQKLVQYKVSAGGTVSNTKIGSTVISTYGGYYAAILPTAVAASGNIYIFVTSSSGISIYKFNSSGVLQTVKTLTGSINSSYPVGIDSSENTYIYNNSTWPYKIYKFDSSLNQQGYFDASWANYLPAGAVSIAPNSGTSTGLVYAFNIGYYCCCYIYSYVFAKDKNWYWQNNDIFGNTPAVNVDSSGNVYILYDAYAYPNNTPYNLSYIKFNSTGVRQFSKGFYYSQGALYQKIIFDGSGNSYIIFSNNDVGYPIYIIKYNSSGTQQWVRELYSSTGYYAQIFDAQISSNDPTNIYITFTTDTSVPVPNFILIKIPTDGSLTQSFWLNSELYTYAVGSFADNTGTAWTTSSYTYSPSSTSFTVTASSDTLSSTSSIYNIVDIL